MLALSLSLPRPRPSSPEATLPLLSLLSPVSLIFPDGLPRSLSTDPDLEDVAEDPTVFELDLLPTTLILDLELGVGEFAATTRGRSVRVVIGAGRGGAGGDIVKSTSRGT